jgi:hypothetical protein
MTVFIKKIAAFEQEAAEKLNCIADFNIERLLYLIHFTLSNDCDRENGKITNHFLFLQVLSLRWRLSTKSKEGLISLETNS